MNITIVNGSPRKNGSTAILLKHARDFFTNVPDTLVDYIDLIDFELKQCTGCRHCYRTGRCSIVSDQIESLSNRVKSADGIIIGSPTYGSNVTGLLKSFMDRGHFSVEQSLEKKFGMAIVTYEIAEGIETYKQLNKFFLVAGAKRRKGMVLKLDHQNKPQIAEGKVSELKRKLISFHKAIWKNKSRSPYEFIFSRLVLIPIIWRPIFEKRAAEFAGILNLWKEKGI